MRIEIWSDVVCPFCYIGKRHFEAALRQFQHASELQIIWKSFLLAPEAPEEREGPLLSYAEVLAQRKGFSAEQVAGMFQHVTGMARAAGLDFHLEKAVATSTLRAHRLIQAAQAKGLGDTMEETLFKAFFTDGKDIGDLETLIELGEQAGLSEAEAKAAFTDDRFAQAVARDVEEARQLGISGVPFFVLDRKYGVSGAQPVEVFSQSLEKAFSDWRAQHPEKGLQVEGGPACTPDGICE